MSKPGTRMYGIFSAQIPDNVGEIVSLQGIEDKITLLIDEHANDNSFHNIGMVTNTKKIFRPADCETEYHKKCWDYAQAPFLYGEAELFDGEGHPDAISAASIMRFCARPDIQNTIHPGFSLDGGIIQRTDASGQPTEDKEKGKHLTKVFANRLAFTLKPACPKARAWLFNDLAKSDYAMPAPQAYLDALKKSVAPSSVIESLNSTQAQLIMKTEQLKKSLEDFLRKGMTSIKCQQCAAPTRFFKTSTPNRCSGCDAPFSMSAIWKSWNK